VTASVSLRVCDALGRHVTTLLVGTQSAGLHAEVWHGRNDNGLEVGSGVYFIILETGNERFVRNAVMLK